MELGELITALEQADARLVVPSGFTNPHSYRGYYDDLAFEPASNVTVAAMLADAQSALGATYEGYKGGEFTMNQHTDCWLAFYGCVGETIGSTLLQLMLAAGTVPDGAPTYVEQVTAALTERLNLDPALTRLYAVLALAKGTATTMEDVHDAWAVWRADTRPDHPSIRPFAELSPEVQELDRRYMDVIRQVAAEVRA